MGRARKKQLPTYRSESMFSATLRDYVNREHGTQLEYATHLEMKFSVEVSRWISGKQFPIREKLIKIAEDIGITPEALQLLSRISIVMARDVVLEEFSQGSEKLPTDSTKEIDDSESMLATVVRDHARNKREGQNGLADRLGVQPIEISLWVTGKAIPAGDRVEKVAKDIGITPEALQLLSRISIVTARDLVLKMPLEEI